MRVNDDWIFFFFSPLRLCWWQTTVDDSTLHLEPDGWVRKVQCGQKLSQSEIYEPHYNWMSFDTLGSTVSRHRISVFFSGAHRWPSLTNFVLEKYGYTGEYSVAPQRSGAYVGTFGCQNLIQESCGVVHGSSQRTRVFLQEWFLLSFQAPSFKNSKMYISQSYSCTPLQLIKPCFSESRQVYWGEYSGPRGDYNNPFH